MSAYTATVLVTRGKEQVDGRYPMTGEFEDYPSPTNTPLHYTYLFAHAQQMAITTGSRFGVHNTLTAAAENGRKRAFCWTPGTEQEVEYRSDSFWEDQCPVRSIFVEVDGHLTRVIFGTEGKLKTYVSGRRVLELANDRYSKLLKSRWKGKTIGKSALLIRGVEVLTKAEAQVLTTQLETEATLNPTPTEVAGTFKVPVSWADKIEELKTNGTDVHISVMPDN